MPKTNFTNRKPLCSAARSSLWVCGLLAFAGCGGSTYDVAPVKGQVTLDGEPIPQTSVMFLPDSGRPAVAITDEQGNYELAYTRDSRGAPPGIYRVEISTAALLSFPKPSDEKFPARYNTETELVYEVKDEINLIDFHLQKK
ncbi:carboxypeptidase-like regulatory domain-containing protein [Blastopirellula retiformator]|uniref:Carboxypeptidase regulatory-like domain-containing protein n=1 Tax=Blastopirellula retiformator TaxID=2527970 RepID=A0A5C5VMP7_9BACT|nr:carboxypeptidase-like regulatory domain-containing protein [Blastopirellula retiformator]TWT39327.1 hypothetical protein Enr8_10250 [Blastopirellula retiformator]